VRCWLSIDDISERRGSSEEGFGGILGRGGSSQWRLDMANDFDERGYLGEEASRFKERVREGYRELVELFEELNSFSQAKKFLIESNSQDGQQVLTANIFIRLLNGAQAVYILCGYGLAQEAQVLLRSLLEGLIILAKIVLDPDFVTAYVLADEYDRLKLLEAAQKRSHPVFEEMKKHISPEQIASLRRSIKERGVERLNLARLANEAGMGSYYDSAYRLLSPGVHFRARSLEEYVGLDEDGEITKVEWGPKCEDVPFILYTAMDIVLRSWGAICQLFKIDLNRELEAYREKLQRI